MTLQNPTIGEITELLEGKNQTELFESATKLRQKILGTKVFPRGLIEITNKCQCDCKYCGIRCGNPAVQRYELSSTQVLKAAQHAHTQGLGSVVIQGGELHNTQFTQKIARLCQQIKKLSGGELAITLSLGQQPPEVYELWKNAGADRYLLRIETTNPQLFSAIHPPQINFTKRLSAIQTLIKLGYQTGSGVMIGQPGQTTSDIAQDLLWMRDSGIVMCGMGPYIPAAESLLGPTKFNAWERVQLTLRATAILRLLMPKINIAASTALGTLDPTAKPLAMKIGANVLMPNITPADSATNYQLYDGKNPATAADLCNYDIKYHSTGTSLAFKA